MSLTDAQRMEKLLGDSAHRLSQRAVVFVLQVRRQRIA